MRIPRFKVRSLLLLVLIVGLGLTVIVQQIQLRTLLRRLHAAETRAAQQSADLERLEMLDRHAADRDYFHRQLQAARAAAAQPDGGK
jgi:hypothetical protein